MRERSRVFSLIIVMAASALSICGVTIAMLYRTAVEEETARLVATAKSQARLIEAIARYAADRTDDRQPGTGDPAVTTLRQVMDAHKNYRGFGRTGEFTLARRDGDRIVFLLRHRHSDVRRPEPVAFSAALAEPMRRALSGKSGTVTGLDYRGEIVLAAHEPVALLNLGIVAKIDMAEIREPFIRSGLAAAGIALLVVLASAVFFLQVSDPMIRQLRADAENLKSMLHSLDESERRLSTLMGNLPGMAYRCRNDSDWTMEFLSEGCVDITGYKPDELVGNRRLAYNDLIHPNDRQMVWDRIQEAVDRREPFQLIYRIASQTGQERWVWEKGVGVFMPGGAFAGLEGFIADISEFKRVEEALKKSEERYREMVENISDVIFQTDADGMLTYVSPVIGSVAGYRPDELLGGHFSRIVHPEDQALVARRFADRISGRILPTEYRILSRSGDPVWVRSSTNLISEAGKPIGVQGVLTDISMHKKAEEETRKLEDRVLQMQKMEAIGTLAGGVAHDFNNILMSVFGYTELALEEAEKGSLQESRLKEILVAGNRAKELVQQILTFSRQTGPELKPVAVRLIVKEAVKLLRASLPSTIEIRKDLQSDALAMADPTQAHQVVMNLCTNAAHAMADRGGVLEIAMQTRDIDEAFTRQQPGFRAGSYIQLSVSDTGHGMSAGLQDRIFDPFFTTKRKGEGTGMGLAVVHGIVKSHGGLITVNSEPEKGATFHVFFPVIRGGAGEDAAIVEILPTGSERILFVDDEEHLTVIAEQILVSLGYAVETRASSIEALTLFKSAPDWFDVVITDMTMPHLTGDALAREILGIRPDIPVILCTGFSARIDRERAAAIGIREYLMKPILKRELAATVRKVLDAG